MPDAAALRDLLMQAVNELTNRGMSTDDPAEQALIEREIGALNRRINRLDQMLLLDAAAAVASSADALAEVVSAARTGPFDRYVTDMTRLIDRMRLAHEQSVNEHLGTERAFPRTEDVPEIQPAAPLAPRTAGQAAPRARAGADGANAPAAPAAAPAPAPPEVVSSRRFADLKAEYEAAWACCEIRGEKRGEIDAAATRARSNKARYEEVAAHCGGMPWQFLAAIHGMEAGFRFDRHLHNGDPLTARTVRVPAGRPLEGSPPFTWEASARDAMALMGYDRINDWSLPHMLYLLEKYNGFGYRAKGLRTPYLWSYTNLYEKGRYVADGVFDPQAVSRQCGAAALLRVLS